MFCFSWDEEADDFLDDGKDGEAKHGEETEDEKPLEAGELVRVHWVCSQFLVLGSVANLCSAYTAHKCSLSRALEGKWLSIFPTPQSHA
jgi:hypothetical protein